MSLSTDIKRIWQHHDILLYLCRFINGRELVFFASSCQLIYQTIVYRPGYWERRYRKVFCLGDKREQEWLTWYSWCINALPKLKESTANVNKTNQEQPLSSTGTTIDNNNNEFKPHVIHLITVPNFDSARWFYAYYQRQQINCNFMTGRLKKHTCQLPIDEYTRLKLANANPWYALIWTRKKSRIWLIQHNVFRRKIEPNNKELAWKELTISLSSKLFCGKAQIYDVYGTNRFVVAYIDIMTYNGVKCVAIGDEIVDMDEMKSRYIRNEIELINNVDEHPSISTTTAPLEKQSTYCRNAIVVWPNAGYSPSYFIYLKHKAKDNRISAVPNLVNIYDNWILFQTVYKQSPYQKINLFDLDRNQWIEGPRLLQHYSCTSVQFTSPEQCQLLTWTIIRNYVDSDTDSTLSNTQNFQNANNDKQLLRIEWELFDIQKGQSQCNKILSDKIIIPYSPDALIQAEMYSEKMCLMVICDTKDMSSRIRDGTFSALLSLFVFDKFTSKDSLQSLFDARDYGQSRPIDGSDQGRILWSRSITNSVITTLYSEKLIIVRNYGRLDVLSAQDGNLLRSINCPFHTRLSPFLGPLCAMLNGNYGHNWLVDVHTGRIYNSPACLSEDQTEDKKDKQLGVIEATPPPPDDYIISKNSGLCLSNVVIGRINVDGGGLYESYTL
ncbi:hypothetical protein BDF19DRAFT_423006 [Syncephalis fuscata]|nr:hypothetical protein BDF19DRAFT_423006 [Syncephalis fuscata]